MFPLSSGVSRDYDLTGLRKFTMRKEDGFLNIKEPRRVYVMEQVMQGKITVRHAAEVLGLGERQIIGSTATWQ